MPRVVITLPAKQDLAGIWAYIAKDNVAAADALVDRIRNLCDLYATQPELGTPGDRFAPGLRYFSVGSYVVFYRATDEALLVVRVLHGARDLGEIFGH